VGRSERRKGKEGELEAARIAREHGFPEAGRNGDARQVDGDLANLGLGYVNVKRCETLRPDAWSREVEHAAPAGRIPAIVYRRSGEPWRASILYTDFLELLAIAQRVAATEAADDLRERLRTLLNGDGSA
jgi:hypothetical protein